MTNKNIYNEDTIKSLDWREHIRLRPGMYIGKIGDGSSIDDGIYILLKVIIDNREYHDTADKLVFHMRFFDGDRTPTNSDYMELFNKRSKLKLNTLYEEIFIRQCITHNVIKEII